MKVWTTKEVCSLIPCDGLPIKLLPEETVRGEFLKKALPDDVAITEFDYGYYDLIKEMEGREVRGNLIFIAREPVALVEEHANTIVLDLKRLNAGEIRKIVDFIIKVIRNQMEFRRRLAMGEQVTISDAEKAVLSGQEPPGGKGGRGEVITDVRVIRKLLLSSAEKNVPVKLELRIKAKGESFTARGECSIGELKEDSIAMGHFKPSAIRWGMNEGIRLSAYFQIDDKQYFSDVDVTRKTGKNVYVSIPGALNFAEVRSNVRVEPPRERTVEAYVLLPGEPTTEIRVLDISREGLGFISDKDLVTDETYCFTIVLPEPSKVVVGVGNIRNKMARGRGFRYGVKLLFHPDDEALLAKYVERRDREILRLLKEVS